MIRFKNLHYLNNYQLERHSWFSNKPFIYLGKYIPFWQRIFSLHPFKTIIYPSEMEILKEKQEKKEKEIKKYLRFKFISK